MLNIIEKLPDGFLDIEAQRLDELLNGPTLIHLPGEHTKPLFVSIMLHGNETTGLLAIQDLLKRLHEHRLPRALSIFVGNISAAALKQRRLDGQHDYNRIWTERGDDPEHKMSAQVIEQMRRRGIFASIDVHNNTGLNPHYACINSLAPQFTRLASLFGRTVVYFTQPDGVQSKAFSALCPSVTLECGQPASPYGVEHASRYIETCLKLEQISHQPMEQDSIDLFHTVAIVKIPQGTRFGFGDDNADIELLNEIDRFNFIEQPAHTRLGVLHQRNARLQCINEAGEDVNERYFSYDNNHIELARPIMPSMLTLDEQVIRQDCLCYLMERLAIPHD